MNIGGKIVQTLYFRVWIAVSQNAQRIRNLDRIPRHASGLIRHATNTKRRTFFCFKLSLERGELYRLSFRDGLSQQVATQRLQDRTDATNDECDRERRLVKTIIPVAPEHESVNSRDHESSCSIRGERHVKSLRKGGRVEHRANRID